MLLTIAVFIFTLSLLILVHEFGHFVAAKRAGIKVEEFGLGYPPRIFGWRRGETVYSLNLLPFGGFVKIYGQAGEETALSGKMKGWIVGDKPLKTSKAAGQRRSFNSQPIRTRALVLAAGVLMNFALAMVVLSIGHWFGLPALLEDEQTEYASNPMVQILQVVPDSPAHEAGLAPGDVVKEIRVGGRGYAVATSDDMITAVQAHKGENIVVVVQRGDRVLNLSAIPRISHPSNEGPLGIALGVTAIVRYPWYKAIYRGVADTLNLTYLVLAAFGGLFKDLIFTGQLQAEIAGPVGIYSLVGQSTQLGFVYVLQFIALLSINLGIINILPIPALDGGRLVFLAIEKIKGSPVSVRVEKWVHMAGFAFLIILMLMITWNDIMRFF